MLSIMLGMALFRIFVRLHLTKRIDICNGIHHNTLPGLKTVIEDEEDLIRHSKENKALIFAFNPHDMVRISSMDPLLFLYMSVPV